MDKAKFKKWAGVGLIGVAGLVVAPFIFLAIKGIIGLAIAGAVALALVAVTPAASQWFTNMKFKALETVISYEPVLTLKARAEERWKELATQRDLLTEQSGNLEHFKSKATKFMKEYPEEADDYQKRVDDYEKIFAYRVDLFKKAKAETEQFMKVIDKAEHIYEMAVADAKLGKSFGKTKDFMSVFKEKTAFDAIDRANAQALSSLRMALVDDDFAEKQANKQETHHRVNYSPTGNVLIGNILDIQEIAPENIRVKA